jgi:hypothetical protein
VDGVWCALSGVKCFIIIIMHEMRRNVASRLLTLIRIRIRIFFGSQKLDLGDLFDTFQAQHDWKNIGGVTVKFKSNA